MIVPVPSGAEMICAIARDVPKLRLAKRAVTNQKIVFTVTLPPLFQQFILR
jgi:hypothetical protein